MACRPVIAANVINIRGFIILGNQIFSLCCLPFPFFLGKKRKRKGSLTEEIDPRKILAEGKGKVVFGEKGEKRKRKGSLTEEIDSREDFGGGKGKVVLWLEGEKEKRKRKVCLTEDIDPTEEFELGVKGMVVFWGKVIGPQQRV
ncbi:hypothetical protein CEXT_651091 [Caerostris extrusa]|uniref:Uncharacterized protein n=1 Tax=Caerostris extrusa TaxID=172846 RepID=A0AAV4T6V5_CAEEX|nr:hypothetical protein CEXT_651091 [Caerostris extrusa]